MRQTLHITAALLSTLLLNAPAMAWSEIGKHAARLGLEPAPQAEPIIKRSRKPGRVLMHAFRIAANLPAAEHARLAEREAQERDALFGEQARRLAEFRIENEKEWMFHLGGRGAAGDPSGVARGR